MAINQINSSAYDYAMMLATINATYTTQADITLTNFTTTGVPQIQGGSIFANNGAVFEVTTDTAINDSGVANGWVYVKYSTANSRFEYNVTAPTWDHDKQGYYSSNDRYFFKMYKVGASDFRYKVKFKKFYDPFKIFEVGHYINYASETEDNIFEEIQYLVPNTSDEMSVEGRITFQLITRLTRTNATTITITTQTTSFTIVDGDAGTHTFDLYIDDGIGL
jgi:hypothetical protein